MFDPLLGREPAGKRRFSGPNAFGALRRKETPHSLLKMRRVKEIGLSRKVIRRRYAVLR